MFCQYGCHFTVGKNESYINMQKAFTSIGSAGLAALAVIIATSNATPISMYLSAITFTSLLILPINLFSNQIKDLQRETSSIHDQISKKINNQNQQILLPPIIYRAPFKIVWGFAVILVMASFILFTIGIISLPECGKTSTHSNIPDSLNLIRYCLTK